MLLHRLRRWPNIKQPWVIVFAELYIGLHPHHIVHILNGGVFGLSQPPL